MPDEAEWQNERKNQEGKTQEAVVQGSSAEEMVRDASAEEKEQRVENLVNTSEKLMDLGLTKRETEVALLIQKDFSNAEIAAELFISETTVKKHVTNIFGKAGIKARGELKEMIRNL
ncbi:MAG: helix-turn-helix transcriptional regulator [Lachnospiraceae bacterium]|nr:helix-turn-helix transcriptional regulator [Lachnospiraceae bacterium]